MPLPRPRLKSARPGVRGARLKGRAECSPAGVLPSASRTPRKPWFTPKGAATAGRAGIIFAVGFSVGVIAVYGDGARDSSSGANGASDEGTVLWEGAFEVGGIPEGAQGPSCGTGRADGNSPADQYEVVDEMGNASCTNEVELTHERTRTTDSERSLKILLGPNQQREQLNSTFSWSPDEMGTIDHWYGFSIYYDSDWNLDGGLDEEVSASMWHSAASWRTTGDNGSLNFSGDMNLNNGNGEPYTTFSEPHMVLRRNTVLNNEGFYEDGKGLDKLDLGPIVTEEWMDFVCHIRWSTTSTNALRECWRDGEYMGAKTSLNAVDTEVHRLRVGQYQTTSIDHSRTTYYDNVRIGTSYAAVDPSRVR